MKNFPLSAEDLARELDSIKMELRVTVATRVSMALDLVLENYRAMEFEPWRRTRDVLPRRNQLVLVAYRYRVPRAPWKFEIARLSNFPPSGWVKDDGEYVHELQNTWWRELHGPFVSSEPKTETPGVVTERGGVVTEAPGVGTEAGGVGR